MNASWADFDNDGNLDVYVTNYMTCTGEWATEEEIISQVSYYPDTLYRNNGDGTFSDVTSYLENDPATATTGPRSEPGSARRGSTTTATAGSTCTWPTTSSARRPTATGSGTTTDRRRRPDLW